jgi:single-strand DNA-binding protein
MPRSFSRAHLVGYAGRDAELRHTAAGVPVASFSVAVPRRWLGPDGERHEATDWFNVVAWRRLAELCGSHVAQGRRLYVEGRLETRTWQEEDGSDRFGTEIVAREVILLDDESHELEAPELHYEHYLDD